MPNGPGSSGTIVGLASSVPGFDLKYDYEFRPPSSDVACDGLLTIYAWLHRRTRIRYSSSRTLVTDSALLPQRLRIWWGIGTPGNYIRYCAHSEAEELGYRGPTSVAVSGHNIDHSRPITRVKQPPDEVRPRLFADATFAWISSVLDLRGRFATRLALDTPHTTAQPDLGLDLDLGGDGGVQSRRLSSALHWEIGTYVDGVQPPEDGTAFPSESNPHAVGTTTGLSANVYCRVDPSSAVREPGRGAVVWNAGGTEDHRLEST